MAILKNGRVRQKEDDTVEKIQDLARKVRKILGCKNKGEPRGSGGDIRINTKKFESNLKVMDVEFSLPFPCAAFSQVFSENVHCWGQ